MADQQPGGNGRGLTAFVILMLAVTLVVVVIIQARSQERVEAAVAVLSIDTRTGREAAVKAIGGEHRDLLCLLALDQQQRRDAVRSGDVCGWLFGTTRPQGGTR